jgi:LPXTG-site transpeptidase (sortase) family protein
MLRKYLNALQALSRKRRSLIAAGAASLLALGVLGYAVLPGGGDKEATLVVASPSPQPTATPAPTTPPPPPPPPPPAPLPPPLSDAVSMFIDRIGVGAPVVTYGLDANRAPIVPTGAGAGGIVAWYDFSARPGTGGNAVYAGHVTWNGAAVFYNLSVLSGDDYIRLRDDRGAELTYRVVMNQEMGADDPATLQMMYPESRDMLTIITCGGSFYSTGDPVFGGEYTSRTVIRAELVSVTRV